MAYPSPGIAWVFQSAVFVMLPAGVGGFPVRGARLLAEAVLVAGVGDRVGVGAVVQAVAITKADESTASRRQGTDTFEMHRR
jgi:hypothetical protein